jgi:two-component sensor histidine kinase
MSVRTDAKDKVRAFDIGAVDYITKPINLEEAAARINTHLTIRSLQKNLEENNARLSREIAERKKVEDALRQSQEKIKISLKEKEVLLKEIHHRVKNNLQIIYSLLNLQAANIQDVAARKAIRESQNRVKSMALIHESLYQSQNLARINMGEYVQRLVSHLYSSYHATASGIAIHVNIQDVFLDIDTAIPCGLLINELVSNSFKHAFPSPVSQASAAEGRIQVDLTQEGDQFVLVVADNGVGVPQDVDIMRVESLGLQLVAALTEQVRGTLDLRRGNGALFRITFPVK